MSRRAIPLSLAAKQKRAGTLVSVVPAIVIVTTRENTVTSNRWKNDGQTDKPSSCFDVHVFLDYSHILPHPSSFLKLTAARLHVAAACRTSREYVFLPLTFYLFWILDRQPINQHARHG